MRSARDAESLAKIALVAKYMLAVAGSLQAKLWAHQARLTWCFLLLIVFCSRPDTRWTWVLLVEVRLLVALWTLVDAPATSSREEADNIIKLDEKAAGERDRRVTSATSFCRLFY